MGFVSQIASGPAQVHLTEMLSLKVEAERGSINTEGKMEGGGVCIGCRVRVKIMTVLRMTSSIAG